MSSPLPLIHPTTYLFVPGHRPDRFAKALATAAGAVIIDLEDAVAPEDKTAAREAIRGWCAGGARPDKPLMLRINDESTPWHADDIALAKSTGLVSLMLPKCESAQQVTRVLGRLGAGGSVMVLVETARGIHNVEDIAASGASRIAFGTLDYAVDLDLSGDERGLEYASAKIAHASRIAGIPSPVAGVTPDIAPERVVADLAFARAFGFGAKLCIHPAQVEAVRGAMKPTEEQVAWARRVIDATASNAGAVKVDGKMVDKPVILKAERILAASQG